MIMLRSERSQPDDSSYFLVPTAEVLAQEIDYGGQYNKDYNT